MTHKSPITFAPTGSSDETRNRQGILWQRKLVQRTTGILGALDLTTLVAGLVSWTSLGHATESLNEAARQVEQAWSHSGQDVTWASPLFLASGDVYPVFSQLGAQSKPLCTSIAALGARTTDFSLRPLNGRGDTKGIEHPGAVRSIAGAAMITRCGRAAEQLRRLVIEMHSPRGTVEVVVGHGSRPAPIIAAILPERTPGMTPRMDPGVSPPLVGSWTERVAAAERLIHEQSGRITDERKLVSDSDGKGQIRLRLVSGCHRIMVLAQTNRGEATRPADVDLEITSMAGALLGRDRSFAVDAALDLCVGETTSVQADWVGAPSGAEVTLVHGHWELSPRFPPAWGPRVRAAMGAAWRKRHGPELTRDPVWSGIGMAGSTVMPVSLRAGACYAVAVAPIQGEVRAMRLEVRLGARQSTDGVGAGDEAALVTFCTQHERRAQIEVGVAGANLVWIGGLWPLGSMPLGEERP